NNCGLRRTTSNTTKLPATTARQVVTSVAMGPTSSTMTSVRVTFDQAMNASTFTAADCSLVLPNGRTIAVSNVKAADSLGKVFDVIFATQSAAGTYKLKIGPNGKSKTAISMVAFTGSYKLPRTPTTTSASATVVSSTPSGPSAGTISSIRVTFDEAIQLSTFTAGDCTLTGPGGTIAVSSVKVVSGSGD